MSKTGLAAMQIIEDNGIESRTWTQTTVLRWFVPSGTPTQPPKLQQLWTGIVYARGKVVRQDQEWRDVETVVIDD